MKQAEPVKSVMGREIDWFGYGRDRWWTLVNVVVNFQVPKNSGNLACFLPGRAKDLSAPLYEIKVKWSLYKPGVAQRVGRGIALLFHDGGTRRGWVVSSTPRPHFNPEKDPVPIVQEDGWAPGPVWTGGKSRPHRDSIPDRPARSSVAIPTEQPGPPINEVANINSTLEKTLHLRPEQGSNPRFPWQKTVHVAHRPGPLISFLFR